MPAAALSLGDQPGPCMSLAVDVYRRRRDTALAAADRAFIDVPRVDSLDGCTFCYSEEWLAQLGGDPDSISDDLIRRFAYEGVDHWNDDQYPIAWRRMAGRILRLLDTEDQGIDAGLLLRGLSYSCNKIDLWPTGQRDAALEVLRATLDLWLVAGRRPDAVIELLGALAHVHDDITPWFAQIEAATEPAVEAGLVRLAAVWAADLLWGDDPSWWWYPADPAGIAQTWLCSPAVQNRLAVFARRNPRCKNAADALAATESLATDGHGLWLYPQSHPPRPASWMLPVSGSSGPGFGTMNRGH